VLIRFFTDKSVLFATFPPMKRPPSVLVTPSIARKGREFGDLSLSLSVAYSTTLTHAGAVPLVMPTTASRDDVVAECVRCADGVVLTGGDDLNPGLYSKRLRPSLRRTVLQTPDGGKRDLCELMVIDEVFRQRKPLLAICRGHQLLNVAFGGSLWVDIREQVKGAKNHSRSDKKNRIVHEVHLTPGSLLSSITARRTFGVNSTHHQAVARPGSLFQVSGQSSDGIVESVEFKPEASGLLPFLVSVQFHPERLAARYPEHRAIFVAFTRACRLNRNKKL
jgi:putative glutamine amidotransferase